MSNKYLDEQGLQTVLTLLDDRYIHKNGNIIDINYSALVSLRDNSKLIKGCKYRIIDYITKTGQSGTTSAEHPFDIIVEALDTNILSEHATACKSNRSTIIGELYPLGNMSYGININGWSSVNETSIETSIPETIKIQFSEAHKTENVNIVNVVKYGKFSNKSLEKGELKVSFNWVQGSGSHKITCIGVDIIQNNTVIASDYHRGTSGNTNENNIYYLQIPDSGTYLIRCFIDTTEQLDSSCDISAINYKYETEYCFKNNHLESWKLKYSLDNNTSRFSWANSNGKGVIYYMKDEYNNEATFDFKNIKYDGFYTFDYNINGTHYDGSVKYGNKCFNNILCNDITAEDSTNIPGLPKIIFKNISESSKCCLNTFTTNAWNVIFGDGCSENKFLGKAENLTFGDNCINNTFGQNCKDNSLNSNCQNNIFGNNCTGNQLYSNCQNNTFELSCGSNCLYDYCNNNTFGNNCINNQLNSNCQNNIFGDNCANNIFGNLSYGAYCAYNTFGDNCANNYLSYYCQNNTFELSCGSNCLYDNCQNNIFGNNCTENSLTKFCTSNILGDNCSNNIIGANSNGEFNEDPNTEACKYNTFGNNCNNNILHYASNYNIFGKDCDANILEYGNKSNRFDDSCTGNKLGTASGWNTFKSYCTNNIAGENFQSNSFGIYCSNNNFGKNNLRFNIGNKVQYFKICKANSTGNGPNTGQILSYIQQIEVGDNCNNLTLYTADPNAGTENYYIQNYKIGNSISDTIDLENNCTNKTYITNVEKNVNNEIKKHCLINGAVALNYDLSQQKGNLDEAINRHNITHFVHEGQTNVGSCFETSNNNNSTLWIGNGIGIGDTAGHQLGFSSNGNIYHRSKTTATGSFTPWKSLSLQPYLSTNVQLGTIVTDVSQSDEDNYNITSVRLDKDGKLAVCVPKAIDVNLSVGSGLTFNNNILNLSLSTSTQLGTSVIDVSQSDEDNYNITSVRLDKDGKLAVCVPKQTSTTSNNSFITVDTSMMDTIGTVDYTINDRKLKYNTILALSTGVAELKIGSNSFITEGNNGSHILSYGITIDVEKTKFTYPNDPNNMTILWANNEAPCNSGGNLDKGLWEFIFTYTPGLNKYSGTFAKYS